MEDPILHLLMTNKNALLGAIGLTAGITMLNRYYEYKLRKEEDDEEEEEKGMIEKLKQTLPESTIKKYGLRKY